MSCLVKSNLYFFLCLLFISHTSFKIPPGSPRILVFSRTEVYHHASIANGNTAIIKLGHENGFEVDTTTNSEWFNEDSLKHYAAVLFLSTTGNVLNSAQEVAFERYIQSGGGFVGVHGATDTEYDWGWYGRLVGGYFTNHPKIQEAVLHVIDSTHPSTKSLPKEWKRTDEWYNFKNLSRDIKPLITIDEKSYEGGTLGGNHPMAWYHEFDGGRAFYTELGHTEESYVDPLYLSHLLGGIKYAMGQNNSLDYGKAKSKLIPDEDRFVKTTLTQGKFYEPTEMAILPNLDVLIIQRRGEVLLYNNKTKDVQQAGFLKSYNISGTPGVNAEEGILGLALDPDFKNNNHVYIYYSPVDTSVNRLSRFDFKNNKLDLKSEKIVLELYSQRKICCHTGGSIAFGKDNLLYLSTGDNSTPFDEKKQAFVSHGFAPLNDAPGHEQYDARRSAGNTNDLRGKILRIRIKPDGTYEIPEGNLFVNTPKTRPEIFVMGNRNPYRITVDKHSGFLYWGEVGPDANNDSFATRGPRGYDEVNQARKAGFYGWPLFVGDNYPYHEYDYTTGKSGKLFDATAPVNESRNNTGLTKLPPAQPAFIWYPYIASAQFPQVGIGGRNAMAGPVYYADDFNKATRLPDYYNGKLFVYDWVRGWVKAVTMKPNGDFDKMESFIQNTKLNSPIDMELGPDGRIYVLEYGTGWFTKNDDAGLSRLDFIAGNRPPEIKEFVITKTSGLLPYTVRAMVSANDPEKKPLKYVWKVGNIKLESKEPTLTYTLKKGGSYPVSVTVLDEQKLATKSKAITVYAGNEQAEVNIRVKPNTSFYFTGKPVEYSVSVKDKGGKVNLKNLYISTDNISGFDKAEQPMGHLTVVEDFPGKNIMLASDCKTCHKENSKSIGPSYVQVSKRYAGQSNSTTYLVNKILKGGSGVWGENVMPAHAAMKQGDVAQIVKWVLSLSNKSVSKSLPAVGKITPPPATAKKTLVIQASYIDNGGVGMKPLKSSEAAYLRSNIFDADEIKEIRGFTKIDSADIHYLNFPAGNGWIKLSMIDLDNISKLQLSGLRLSTFKNNEFAIAVDKPDGENISTAMTYAEGNILLQLKNLPSGKVHDVYILYKSSQNKRGAALLQDVRFLP